MWGWNNIEHEKSLTTCLSPHVGWVIILRGPRRRLIPEVGAPQKVSSLILQILPGIPTTSESVAGALWTQMKVPCVPSIESIVQNGDFQLWIKKINQRKKWNPSNFPIWYDSHYIWASQVAQWWRNCKRHGFNPWVRKIPWKRAPQPTSVLLPGESHGQRSLVDYSPQNCKELNTTKETEHTLTHYIWAPAHIRAGFQRWNTFSKKNPCFLWNLLGISMSFKHFNLIFSPIKRDA